MIKRYAGPESSSITPHYTSLDPSSSPTLPLYFTNVQNQPYAYLKTSITQYNYIPHILQHISLTYSLRSLIRVLSNGKNSLLFSLINPYSTPYLLTGLYTVIP